MNKQSGMIQFVAFT